MQNRFKPLDRRAWLNLGAIALLLAGPGAAMGTDYFWTGGVGPWTIDSNWSQGLAPEAEFEEVGIINNGGTATLNTAAVDSAGLVLGQGADESGTLLVQSGGSINFVETLGAATEVPPIGVLNIGLDGTGRVEVQGGGALSTTLVDMNAGSVLEIGGGAGSASVTSTAGMWLAGRTVTHGAGHTFTAATFVTFQGGTQYVVDLSSASHTTLVAGGAINDVQGPLIVETSGGYTPALGESWDLLDGVSIAGDFDIDTSALGPLPAGTDYRTRRVAGGNGRVLQLVYQALPTMTVNTDTGAVTIVSESGGTIDLVGYSILSPGGQLTAGSWNSLSDQSQPGWEEAGAATPNALSELNAQGSLALGSTPVGLGPVYNAPTEFGVAPSISFEYAVEGDSQPSEAIVKFTGSFAVNNLLLTVDPATGEGQLKNSSPFDIELLGYSILSDSGSLDDANWGSLESSAVSGWDDAASDEFSLNELVPEGFAMLSAGQSYSLGDMFSVGGDRDLEIEFLLAVDGVGETRQGVVRYGAIPAGVEGDYNNDGVVDAADYTVWRDNLGGSGLPNEGAGVSPGTVDNADYAFWRSRYGASSGAGAGAGAASVPAPEPSAVLSAIWAVLASLGVFARRRVAVRIEQAPRA